MASTPVSAMTSPIQKRTAGRMFLIDSDRRVLLMHERKDIGSESSHWITPGGGVEAGETLAQGAMREVLEETGLRVALPPDARPIFEESVLFTLAGNIYDQANHYFLARVPSGLVIEPAGHTEVERLVVIGHKWWSLAELDASDVIREPVAMVEVIERALDVESGS
jgi:8-oxo-dGTP pyrophosphatase MutT (NUDIX family)